MSRVIGVNFEPHGPLRCLDAGDLDVRVGDLVLYPTEHGPEVAKCVWVSNDESCAQRLPKCPGKAALADLERDEANRAKRAESEAVAKALIAEHDLPMKVVGIDFVDRSSDFDQQVVVYFTAPHRVDFRALLGDLARALRSRIDLRQVASRDAARLLGGVGSCGRVHCCVAMEPTLEPVALRLAKMQSSAANPASMTGSCGRLMCCLQYEHDAYIDFARAAPPVGARVLLDGETVEVVSHRVSDDSLVVRQPNGDLRRCTISSLTEPTTGVSANP